MFRLAKSEREERYVNDSAGRTTAEREVVVHFTFEQVVEPGIRASIIITMPDRPSDAELLAGAEYVLRHTVERLYADLQQAPAEVPSPPSGTPEAL